MFAEVTSGRDSVVGVSEQRLGFEPRGEMRVYRHQLRAALKSLTAEPGAGLSVTYAAPDASGVVDLENVALYNVGAGSYSHLLAAGLTCRRVESPDGCHHLTYTVAANVPALPAGLEVAAAGSVTVPSRFGDVGAWWLALRQQVRVQCSVAPAGDAGVVVDVRLTGPWTGPAVANVVKPLLDGLFCAVAARDGSALTGSSSNLNACGAKPSSASSSSVTAVPGVDTAEGEALTGSPPRLAAAVSG